MATNQIMFGGNILPCTVERFPDIHKAQRKFRQYNIPGRNGDIFFQSDAYENVLQSYQIYAGDGTYGSQAPWTELARCLYLDGYQELRDTYDPTHFRKAVFNGPIDVENSWNTHGRATIEFNCRPERYLVDGRNPRQYNAQAEWVIEYARDDIEDMSVELGQWITSTQINALADEQSFYVCTIPSWYPSDDPTITVQLRNDGEEKQIFVIDNIANPTADHPETPDTTADYISFSGAPYSQTGVQIVIPQFCIVGYPMVYLDFAGADTVYGTTLTLQNPYMKSYPTITLHRVLDHHVLAPEAVACRINNFCVYISQQDATTPAYYFVDVENFIITSSDTPNGTRSLANNARMDSGLSLLSGENAIFPSMYYDMSLIPNWWEL